MGRLRKLASASQVKMQSTMGIIMSTLCIIVVCVAAIEEDADIRYPTFEKYMTDELTDETSIRSGTPTPFEGTKTRLSETKKTTNTVREKMLKEKMSKELKAKHAKAKEASMKGPGSGRNKEKMMKEKMSKELRSKEAKIKENSLKHGRGRHERMSKERKSKEVKSKEAKAKESRSKHGRGRY